MSEIWRWINLGLAFVVELVALGVFAWWGWRTGNSTLVRLLLAIGLPLITAFVWGLFAAPTASYGNPVITAIVKVAMFGLAGLALWSLDHRILAVVFVVVVESNLLVIRVGDLTAGTSPTIQRTTE
ncbi:uncharacterized protein DUF2568 [Kribbella sp. VKM Ac-2527]|uniref:Uncharacterized protein DUF2568 n=1 Tax=Kribbella caucasensis TaxID=2512215 RepID=A0A4R6KTD9_9ACTN|nr:YrdB family protein [Kribbella sp. VKM Ac-2527]TDO54778.1 uncharacterized protein DUF2568 [Kribbella sp. VKM Ac-2527]